MGFGRTKVRAADLRSTAVTQQVDDKSGGEHQDRARYGPGQDVDHRSIRSKSWDFGCRCPLQ
jgi:hypothetical protein